VEDARSREFLALAWSVGRAGATGVLSVDSLRGPRELVEVRDGGVVTSEVDPLGRKVDEKLTRLARLANAIVAFREGSAHASEGRRRWPLDRWARRFLDREVDPSLAAEISREWAGERLELVAELAPDPANLDEIDAILVERLARSATLAELCAAVRAPRYRVFALVHFLRTVGALEARGSHVRPRLERATPAPRPSTRAPRDAALELLGLPPGASLALVKTAFRRLAKTLHPDLHPNAGEATRRELEQKLAIVNAAYGELIAGLPI
jgi:DnaJ-domain-containing protein 1